MGEGDSDSGSRKQRPFGNDASYQGDDVAQLARQAIRQIEGGHSEKPSAFPRPMDSSDQVADLAKAALKGLEGSSGAPAPRFASNDYGGGSSGLGGTGNVFGGGAQSATAELAAQAAQKLTASNQIVAPSAAPAPAAAAQQSQKTAEPADEPVVHSKHHHHKSLKQVEKDVDDVE